MSRCLIYKVHTALSGGLLSYHVSSALSRTFFKFSTFFVLSSAALTGRAPPFRTARLDYHILRRLSSPFFASLKNFFQVRPARPAPFAVSHASPQPASRPRFKTLDYISKGGAVCQPFFSLFGGLFFCRNICNFPPFSTTRYALSFGSSPSLRQRPQQGGHPQSQDQIAQRDPPPAPLLHPGGPGQQS